MKMYLLIGVMQNILMQYPGKYVNYTLEIDIFRNSSPKEPGVPRGDF